VIPVLLQRSGSIIDKQLTVSDVPGRHGVRRVAHRPFDEWQGKLYDNAMVDIG
jgi:hypothetical protein